MPNTESYKEKKNHLNRLTHPNMSCSGGVNIRCEINRL